MALLSCGTEALMFGSLMMLASGVLARSPSSDRASGTCGSNWPRIRPASEMSRSSISIPAEAANLRTIGSSERVARAGASSVSV